MHAHIEQPGDASGTDTGPFQGGVEACGKGASASAVLTATLQMLDGVSASVHLA
ncbi:hypothetical protein [Paraburkholderia hospita]|uniref:hypothetical protein n=1 Tax=Paraburkholderia hospita TaxID=169430 RepID=UPI00030C0F61|nr:hypothetical protein [Paraburkholderia hospita]